MTIDVELEKINLLLEKEIEIILNIRSLNKRKLELKQASNYIKLAIICIQKAYEE